MMKRTSLLVFVALLASISNAYSLMDGFKAATSGSSPRVSQESEEVSDTEAYSGQDPLLGRNVMSVLITDVVNMVAAPGMTSYIAFFFDLFNFFAMPMIGGLMMASVTYNYEKDYITYQNAEIGKGTMYTSQMKLVKSSLYNLIGKPDFFGEETASSYQPPNTAEF